MALIDLQMPGVKSLADVQGLIREFPNIPFVVVSAVENQASVDACIESGAHGYLQKLISSVELTDSLNRISQGDIIHSQVTGIDSLFQGRAPKAHSGATQISERQQQIMQALSKGQTPKYKLQGRIPSPRCKKPKAWLPKARLASHRIYWRLLAGKLKKKLATQRYCRPLRMSVFISRYCLQS